MNSIHSQLDSTKKAQANTKSDIWILGISGFYHDSAACLIKNGHIIAAAQEERFSRKKHDARFPIHAITYCLKEGKITLSDLETIAFYEKPFLKFERLLETYLSYAPKGLISFWQAMPVWLKEKLFLKNRLTKQFENLESLKGPGPIPPLSFPEHHESHAASAFYPSPYEQAAILCMDGVGEWATTSVWTGNKNSITPQWEIPFPHSLGLLYSAFTYYTGFRVNSGEYKVMGLAPYGQPTYTKLIKDHLIDIKPDGTFRLNMEYFNFCTGLTMTNSKFDDLFGGPPRTPESTLTQREMDLARSVQEVTEEVMLQLGRTVHRETGMDYLCMAGGVALNCVGNGRLLREGPFKGIWIQPAAGDAGGAVGAALQVYHHMLDHPRTCHPSKDAMQGSYLGPACSNEDIEQYLNTVDAVYTRYSDSEFFDVVAKALAEGKIIGWFQGRMEFGPRALGGRSILGDPRNPKMQSNMNLKIKYRESFRPFAPAVLRERVTDYFELDSDSPYMLIVAPVVKHRRIPQGPNPDNLWGIDLLNQARSDIPAVTHLDYSARVQTVHEETNPRYYRLLQNFEKQTGCPVLVNTSFNVRGEPIVCSPEDAFRCFMRTEMDLLVLENCVLFKSDQKPWEEETDWKEEFALD
ncbi:carbamoyltransferase [Candidatus Nitronereus thalassa]|uniref:Carbamoyltransferase n=1 Tax=Candidatus Nitronereus thalassa TaxID=3020898 RepID=A0ABU3K3G3_9BACT|nr:carbamoyltransferase [Candidatus Nitronereus thalassa]MDT7040950.1 carbamoyltransferase [Candidatus Nitronereus thalassa]